jgi:hypothetical protein
VNPLQQALRRQFSQVAADCVFGEPQFLAQFLGNDLARPPEDFENELLAVAGKHIATIAYSSAWCARNYTILHDKARGDMVSVEAPMNRPKPMVILIAGPYRSGTNGDPLRIAQNLDRLESFALSIYKAGHIPVIGEWVALPLMKQAGSLKLGDEISEQYLYPVASRLLERCDAVLRIDGESKGADEDLRLARERGLQVYWRMEDVPVLSATQEQR